jgi:endoglucanase
MTYNRTTFTKLIVAMAFYVLLSLFYVMPAHAAAVEVWWPTQDSELSGVQPFKGLLQGTDVNQYTMYWQVDGGNLVKMDTNYQDYPHKEATVDLSGWNWKGTGPYVLNFVAKDSNGQVLGATTRTIYTGPKPTTSTVTNTVTTTVAPAPSPTPTVTQTTTQTTSVYTTVKAPNTSPSVSTKKGTISGTVITATPTPAPAPTTVTTTTVTPTVTNSINPLAGKTLYVDPNSQAAAAVKSASPTDAALLSKISTSPTAVWLGNWYDNNALVNKITSVLNGAKAQNAAATFILYNIPIRDCGSYSAGGANSPDGYRAWIKLIADTIGTNSAVVILEPDGLTHTDCLNSTDKATRMSLLTGAVETLQAKPNIAVYMDAGHSGWKSVDEISALLNSAGVAKADGFSLNVSNFNTTAAEVTYGKAVSAKTGGKHFVIDTARNGNGSNGEWCNPSGRALGEKPTTNTNEPLADGFLWLKAPGESDGQCNGGPSAGTWWTEYALGLAKLAHW